MIVCLFWGRVGKSNFFLFWQTYWQVNMLRKYLPLKAKVFNLECFHCSSSSLLLLVPYIVFVLASCFQTSVRSRQPHCQPKSMTGKKKKMWHHLQKERTQLRKVSLGTPCLCVPIQFQHQLQSGCSSTAFSARDLPHPYILL